MLGKETDPFSVGSYLPGSDSKMRHAQKPGTRVEIEENVCFCPDITDLHAADASAGLFCIPIVSVTDIKLGLRVGK